MKRLGIVARADTGGLSSQSYEARRHLQPVASWVVDMGPHGRGAMIPEFTQPTWEGEEVLVAPDRPEHAANEARAWLLDRVDVILAFETVYGAPLCEQAQARGIDVMVQVNPELFRPTDYPGARFVIPTSWEQHRVDVPVLPVPVARDRLPYRHRDRCEVLYHPAAPAFHDRNGTAILAAALAHMARPVKVYVRGEAPRVVRTLTRSKVDVHVFPPHPGPYWEAYPDDIDVVVLPRRYGGNCLPAQEAASLGCPVVMLDLAPQHAWPHTYRVPSYRAQEQVMRGGVFAVHDAHPTALATALDHLATHPQEVSRLSRQADGWADTLDWGRWKDAYRETLGL